MLTYGEMLARIAELMLVGRPAITLGVNLTGVTARVAAAIAGEDPELVLPLMEGLQGDLLPGRRPRRRAAGRAPALLRRRRRARAARVGAVRAAGRALMSYVVDSVRSHELVAAAAAREVWQMVMDPDCLGDWVTIHRRLVRADDGPPRVGFTMDQQIQLRGVSLEVHWPLVECRPGELAVWEGRGPARSRARTEYCSARRTAGPALTTATSSVLRSARSARSSAARWSAACPSARRIAHSSVCVLSVATTVQR